jgi:hypothetical protein
MRSLFCKRPNILGYVLIYKEQLQHATKKAMELSFASVLRLVHDAPVGSLNA